MLIRFQTCSYYSFKNFHNCWRRWRRRRRQTDRQTTRECNSHHASGPCWLKSKQKQQKRHYFKLYIISAANRSGINCQNVRIAYHTATLSSKNPCGNTSVPYTILLRQRLTQKSATRGWWDNHCMTCVTLHMVYMYYHPDSWSHANAHRELVGAQG